MSGGRREETLDVVLLMYFFKGEVLMVIFNSRLKPGLRCVFLVLVLFMSGVFSAEAKILKVPSQYATIPVAITEGKSGDVIQVAGTVASPFIYTFAGNLTFGKKVMTLESESGNPATVILQGNNTSNSTVYIADGESVGSIFRGITIIGPRGNNGEGGAMNIQVNVKVENCIIRDSSAGDGGGVHISNGALPTFKNCQFLNNRAYGDGGAVCVTDTGTFPVFTNCLFVGNYAYNSALFTTEHGDAIFSNGSPLRLINCTLVATAANQSDDDVIHQDASDQAVFVTNCIITAYSTSDFAIDGNAMIFTQSNPNIASSYISGKYDFKEDCISNVFEPTRVQTSDGVYSNYPNEYVTTTTFNVNFAGNYHLNMTSSAIGIGITGSGSDLEGEPRPYYLSSGTDLGCDQFNFEHLVTNNLSKGTYWFDVSLTPGQQQIATAQSIGRYIQTGKVRFYRIIPTASGVMRIRSANATVDVKGILTDDWTGDNVLGADDNGGGDVNFKIDYIYAQEGKPYYLGVISKNTAATGTYDLIAELVTDDHGNGCVTADTVSIGTFAQTYFVAGYTDRSVTGGIEFGDDEDCYRIAVAGAGTLMITSKDGTTPEEFDVLLKNSQCEVVAENTSSGSVLVIYNNTSAETCYLTVKRNKLFDWETGMNYGLDVRYYPLDEVDPTIITLSGGEGSAGANITVPGDRDTFEFTVPSYGTLTVETEGCTVGQESKVSVYNFLDERILDNGYTVAGTGNFKITETLVSTTANSPDLTPATFTVAPGKYYLKVSALNGHKTPFDYAVKVKFTASAGDDHGNYRQSGTILRKWADVLGTPPLLYFRKEAGQIASVGDEDFYRMDLPYQGTVRVMADFAATNNAVQVDLMDSKGNILLPSADVRAANPHFPQPLASFPEWVAGRTYTVNEIIRYTDGLYYKCIQAGTGSPTDGAYWTAVATPPATVAGILTRKLGSGTYFLKVSGAPGTNYLLSVDLDDFGNDRGDASLPRDNYEYNAFEGHYETANSPAFEWSYDPDAWQLTVDKTGLYTIYTTGSSDTYGNLKDADGNVLVSDSNSGEAGINFKYTRTLNPGIYYIVSCMQDTTKTGDYVLHIDQGDDFSDTYYGTAPNPGTLTAGSSVMGVIGDPGDVDYFTFQPATTGRARFTVTGGIELVMNLSTIVDELVNPSEDRLTHSNAGLIEFDVTAGETYYVYVKPEFVMNTGSYTLSCAMAVVADTDNDGDGGNSGGDDYASARPLTLSGNTASYSDGGVDRENDYDYYRFNVTGPGVVRVYTTGTTDTYGYLFLEYGDMYNLVISNDDSDYDKTDGYNFGMDYYVGPGARTFYVKVRGYAPHETGDYQLHIVFTPGGTDDHGDECEVSTHVRRGAVGSIWESGRIRFDESRIGITGDRDYLRIVAGPEGANPGTVNLYTTDGATSIDSFGYLKNEMCGTLALNDNGSGASDGDNFRISYTPNCTVGVDCIPRTYYGVVKSYNDSQTGTYDLNVETNGASVAPVSVTTMAMTANGSKYFGFETPAEGTYLAASVAGVSGYSVTPLRFTLMNGKGEVIPGYVNLAVGSPIYAQGLDKGIHYIRISNTGATAGDFTLDLNCSGIGSIGFGNGAGTFVNTDTLLTVTADGSPGFSGTSDNGYCVFNKETEGFDFITKVMIPNGNYGGNTQAGIELRQGLADGTVPANGKRVSTLVARNAANTAWNVTTRYRATAGANDSSLASTAVTLSNNAIGNYSYCYLHLHYDRADNTLTTSYSLNGSDWTNGAAITMTFTEPMYVGFAYASGTDGMNRTASFSDVEYAIIPYGEK